MKRFTINMPEDVHTRFKVACTLEKTDMTEIVLKLVQEYIRKAEKKPKN